MQGSNFQYINADDPLKYGQIKSAELLIDTVKDCIPNATESQVKLAFVAAWSIVHGMTTILANLLI